MAYTLVVAYLIFVAGVVSGPPKAGRSASKDKHGRPATPTTTTRSMKTDTAESDMDDSHGSRERSAVVSSSGLPTIGSTTDPYVSTTETEYVNSPATTDEGNVFTEFCMAMAGSI